MAVITHICQSCGAKTTREQGRAAWALCRKCARDGNEAEVAPTNAKNVASHWVAGHGWVSGYGGRIDHVAGAGSLSVWRVFSESSDKAYTVDLGVPNCTCTDWATKRNRLVSQARAAGKSDSSVKYECKHVRAAQKAAQSQAEVTIAREEAGAIDEAARIKAEFKAQKTKKDALAMLKDLKEGR